MGARKNGYAVVGAVDDDTANSEGNGGLTPSQQRLRNDRVYTLVALAGLVVFALSSGMVGVAASQRAHASSLSDRGIIVSTLSRAMTALMEEAAFSVTFTNPTLSYPSGTNGQTDREIASEMTRLQAATRDAIDDAVNARQKRCESCASILTMFDYPLLLNAQMAVMMRADTPTEVFEFYAGAQLRLMQAMAYYAGWGVEGGVASAAWAEQLILAGRSMTFASGAWQDAYTTQSFMTRSSYQLMSWAVANYRLVVPFGGIMQPQEGVNQGGVPPSIASLEEKVLPMMNAVRKVMSSGTTSLQNLQSVGSVKPEDVTAEILAIYRSLLDEVDARDPWGKVSERNWKWILGTSIALVVLGVVLIGVAISEATALVWAAGAELGQMQAKHRLESSLTRMHAFVDSMYQLDRNGLSKAVSYSESHSSNATNAERELLQLAGPASQVLSYINPCILDRCVRPSVPSEYVPGSPDGEELDRDSVLNGHIRNGLSLRPMSIAMVDLRCFAVTTVTVETSRSLPKDLFVFLNEMVKMAGQCGGTVLGISGTALIIGWNAVGRQSEAGGDGDASHVRGRRRTMARGGADGSGNGIISTENDACQMLVRFRLANLHRRYPKVHIAVVSGICEQGVVGTASLRSYVVAGNFVRLGRMLLDMARLHNVSFVTDTATFLKLDTQMFRKRAIEMAVLRDDHAENTETDDNDPKPRRSGSKRASGGAKAAAIRKEQEETFTSLSASGKTIVYEVTIAGTEAPEYEVLWNGAFDDFFSGRAVESFAKLVAWSRHFGKRQTWKRAASMLSQTSGYDGATVARTRTGKGFDYEMIV